MSTATQPKRVGAIRQVPLSKLHPHPTFAGSGSTLIACERTGRRARLMEIDPAYCDVIRARYKAFTEAAS